MKMLTGRVSKTQLVRMSLTKLKLRVGTNVILLKLNNGENVSGLHI